MVGVGGVLAVIWGLMITPSAKGYGYSGYNGYRGGGIWLLSYGSAAPIYRSPSVKNGSRSGPGVTGKGLRGGK
jgi:hypothetical protein